MNLAKKQIKDITPQFKNNVLPNVTSVTFGFIIGFLLAVYFLDDFITNLIIKLT